ncbi:UNVERIFIED_CONTAM: hypothetical protein H355_010112 [Colinus virginianus]|nr:hypothetical protein H355_010112 [Colinus virginianus]
MMAERLTSPAERVRIGVVGKYTGLADSYLSVVKALQHGAMEAGVLLDLVWIESSELEKPTPGSASSDTAVASPSVDAVGTPSSDAAATPSASSMTGEQQQGHNAAWEALRSVQGVVCPGGFGDRGINGKAASAGYCRRSGVPYLGICLGMQTAVIDFARDVLELKDANSEEFDPSCAHPVVVAMPEHTSVTQSDVGGTMRLGKRATIIRDPTSLAARLYDGRPVVDERHRHRYEVNPLYVKALEAKGLLFVGQNERGQRMEIAELQEHPFFLCVQYHPEFTSRPLRPSPLFLGLILAAAGKLQERLKQYNGYLRSGATYEQRN